MSMFKVTWVNYGELDNTSTNFCSLTYDVSNHRVFYETCNSIRHCLRCDFGSIFDKLHSMVSSEEFQNEKPCEDGCDGDWYKFEYTLNGKEVHYEGYIYGLKLHKEVIYLIESCAKSELDDEKKLLQHGYTNEDWVLDIIESRKKLEEDFLDFWVDINTNLVQIPDGFIKCNKCSSIIDNKYYKNRKYWGRVWLSGEFGDYEVEYDSGECPVCGELNTELPDTGIECQPDDLDDSDSDRLYSADELDYLLRYLSDEDRVKVSDCQFKLVEQYPDDDSGDMYYDITVYMDNNEVGKIDMQYHSNTYWDLIDDELKTTNDTPYYSYTMTLNEDSKEDSKNPFDDTFGSSTNPFDNLFDNIKSPFDNIKSPFDDTFGASKSHFDDSKFRCKKCGKIFCTCGGFFNRKG